METTLTSELCENLRSWRHHLHRNPELPFQEHGTAAYLAGILETLGGVEVTGGIGGTGLVATLTRGSGAGVIGLRADMDCLPLAEAGDHAHISRNGGAMHACGHDGHMTMVLGAAAALAAGGGFDGTVRFIFQPAEEPGRGARAMVDDGLFDTFPVDRIYGLHNLPSVPAGHFHLREGALLASEDNFEIRIRGRGGHASMPEVLVDPLVVGAEIILALQTVVARNIPPSQSAVVSCTEVVTDGSRNAIPSEVIIRGDTRSYTPEVREILERRIRGIAEGLCAGYGASCTVSYIHEFEPTVNHPGCVEAAARAAISVVGPDGVNTTADPVMGSEDFGVFAREVPGCFAFIGNGTEPGKGGTPLHSSDYDFNDDILAVGVEYYVTLIRSLLPVST
ncbi:M20 aminoacylase family protein [Saccharopolyspora cebuensis]|uniref:M20 aminoacylase family protein n=1 Tax=Saccharopolyspora cebuensis TaxID=418759 RepID=A0ABV4CHF6_9PSEU